MNPFKWFARWVLSEDLIGLNVQIIRQEAEITRLMDMIRKDGNQNAENVGRFIVANRHLKDTVVRLDVNMKRALKVHDDAKSPNSTVKRMARILREYQLLDS